MVVCIFKVMKLVADRRRCDMIWECGVLMSTYFSSSHVRLDTLNFVAGELHIVAESSLVGVNGYLVSFERVEPKYGVGNRHME